MTTARIILERSNTIAPVNRRVFGSFVEHLGRCVYDGIYEPSHPTANADGFRLDVVDLVKELGSTTIRYPGGNFVSGYRWEDGVGPRSERPRRLDLAWHSLETNEVGIDEFARWCALTGSELMMAVNLGTRGIQAALDLLEYSNHPSGTELSDLRVSNGAPQPHGIKMWCLGNEMDGPWQIGHMDAADYGKLAGRTASAMKTVDPSLELVICGSSGSSMPTFGDWERTVLEHAYESVDFISCHAYYQERRGDLASFLASAIDMQYFIETVISAADHVGSKKRSDKKIMLSFDEWNVWYLDESHEAAKSQEGWPYAPRLLEDVYSVADAVVVGDLLMTLLSNADRVTSASLAQLVNVIAPIMTEPGGGAWRQTTFFPFSVTSRLAKGVVLRPRIEVATYQTAVHGVAELVHSIATWDEQTGRTAVFLVNRDIHTPITVSIDMKSLDATQILECTSLSDADPYAKNTSDERERVALQPNTTGVLKDGILTVTLAPVSWTAVALS